MRISVGSVIKVEGPTERLRDWCKENLVIDNPEYEKKRRMGFWTGATPKTLSLYEVDGNTWTLPYGCLSVVLSMTLLDFRDELVLSMPKGNPIDFGGDVPLYDYQQEAVDAMVKAQYGILQSPAGSGKTQMGIALAAALGRNTLWITHTRDLLEQSFSRAAKYLPVETLGKITAGKVSIGSTMTFATIQTLAKVDLLKYRETWDTIIVDECHRVAGSPTAMTQFSRVLNNLSARHKYGLSATVHRADGLIKATYSLLGEVAYAVPEEKVADKIMQVTIQPVATGVGYDPAFLDTDGTLVYNKLVTWLGENEERNKLIVKHLIENQNHSNLILSDRISHLETLQKMLPIELLTKSAVIHGKMTSKQLKAFRAQSIEDMRTGKLKYLFASYSLAKEGLDIPCLDRLYLTTPQKDYAVVTQSIGRIARTCEGKGEPIVYDYIDNAIKWMLKCYKKRVTHYRKGGCNFNECI